MLPGERFKGWIDTTAAFFADRLRGWMASWVEWGAEKLLDTIEPLLAETSREQLDEIAQLPELPSSLRAVLGRVVKPKGIAPAIILIPLAISLVMAPIMAALAPTFRGLGFASDRVVNSFRLSFRTITDIWLRDKPAYEKFWDDLADQGWSDERIDIAKELAKIIPPLPDMVRFADFSAFDPAVIEKWRQFYDAPGWITDPMSLIGITNEPPRDWANKYWFSHWIQPGRYELGEIYRRGLLGEPLVGSEEIGGPGGEGEAEETIKLAYRTMGYSAYWQDMLLQLVRAVPTRVDVRRWWDMRTIDEEELRSIYQRQGYFGKDLENYVRWTKVYTDFSMMMTRFKNGWITEQDIRDWLKKLLVPEDRIQQFIEEKTKPEKGERVAAERELTKTDITMWVKKDPARWGDGIELLMELGYDEDEANMIMTARVAAAEGSPETTAEWHRITQLWRASAGLPTKMTLEQIRAAEKKLAAEYPLKRKLTEEELKVKVDTLRRRRRSRQLTRDQEIAGLLEIGLTVELATAYADNDDLRLHPEKEGK